MRDLTSQKIDVFTEGLTFPQIISIFEAVWNKSEENLSSLDSFIFYIKSINFPGSYN